MAARSVLFAGSRRGQVEQPVCRALVERFRRHGFGFFVGCAAGVDAAFRAALARRTLWLVKRSSLVVLFPERPADRQWGSGSRLAYRSALYRLKPT